MSNFKKGQTLQLVRMIRHLESCSEIGDLFKINKIFIEPTWHLEIIEIEDGLGGTYALTEDEVRSGFCLYKPDKEKEIDTNTCNHRYKWYEGIFEKYEYCIYCGEKKE